MTPFDPQTLPVGKKRGGASTEWLVPVLGAVAVLAAFVWAFAPLERLPALDALDPDPSAIRAEPPPAATPSLVALNRAAFHTPVWVVPPPPPAPPLIPPSPPPSPPLKLQLLAIISETVGGVAGYRAMVYDPDSDTVLLVAPGERLGGRTVDSIDELTVRIKDDTGTRVLTVKAQGGTP